MLYFIISDCLGAIETDDPNQPRTDLNMTYEGWAKVSKIIKFNRTYNVTFKVRRRRYLSIISPSMPAYRWAKRNQKVYKKFPIYFSKVVFRITGCLIHEPYIQIPGEVCQLTLWTAGNRMDRLRVEYVQVE